MLSNSSADLEQKEPYGSLVLQVIEIYRRSNHYKLSKLAPQLVTEIAHISVPIIEQAISIYEKAKDRRTGKAPHPSYFVAVAKRLHEECGRVDDDTKTPKDKTLWGRSI